jgi:hypothetical protein
MHASQTFFLRSIAKILPLLCLMMLLPPRARTQSTEPREPFTTPSFGAGAHLYFLNHSLTNVRGLLGGQQQLLPSSSNGFSSTQGIGLGVAALYHLPLSASFAAQVRVGASLMANAECSNVESFPYFNAATNSTETGSFRQMMKASFLTAHVEPLLLLRPIASLPLTLSIGPELGVIASANTSQQESITSGNVTFKNGGDTNPSTKASNVPISNSAGVYLGAAAGVGFDIAFGALVCTPELRYRLQVTSMVQSVAGLHDAWRASGIGFGLTLRFTPPQQAAELSEPKPEPKPSPSLAAPSNPTRPAPTPLQPPSFGNSLAGTVAQPGSAVKPAPPATSIDKTDTMIVISDKMQIGMSFKAGSGRIIKGYLTNGKDTVQAKQTSDSTVAYPLSSLAPGINRLWLILVDENGLSARKEVFANYIPDTTPPVITLLNISERERRQRAVETMDSVFTIEGVVSDSGTGVKKLVINFSLVKVEADGRFSYRVPLPSLEQNQGQQKINYVLSAEDFNGNVSNPVVSLDIVRIPRVPDPRTRSFALIFAVESYKDKGIKQLNRPIADADSLRRLLTAKYEFEAANVLLYKNPTRAEIIKAFFDIRLALGEYDQLLIFYAGHGSWDKSLKQGWWLPADAEAANPSQWVSNADITTYMRPLKARHILLVSDACFGGSFLMRDGPTLSDPDIVTDFENPSRAAMTSGSLNEVPDESVFMRTLLEQLSRNTARLLRAHDLFRKIDRLGLKPEPKYGTLNDLGDQLGEFFFVQRRR